MEYNFYYVLGGLALVYIIFSVYNKRNARKRKSRKFMDSYERKTKKDNNSGAQDN